MRLNKGQFAIAALTVAVVTFLVLYPSWQEAAEKETAYRRDVGRGFLWKPPRPVAVDCYFAGCVIAPASYFHVILDRKLLLQQSLAVLYVGLALLWVFRIRRNGTASNLKSAKTRATASLLLALLIPPAGNVPIGAGLLGAPTLLLHRGGEWALPLILVLLLYCACAGLLVRQAQQ
jgi:hypothetical protein